jgi:hypothetical protein
VVTFLHLGKQPSRNLPHTVLLAEFFLDVSFAIPILFTIKCLKFLVFASVAADVFAREKKFPCKLCVPECANYAPDPGGGGGWERRSARVSSVVVSELVGECWAQGHSVRKLF